jgi:hypothetical protein
VRYAQLAFLSLHPEPAWTEIQVLPETTMLFHELLFQILEISKIPVQDVDEVGDIVDLEIDGVVFILKNSSTDTEDAIEFLCDFGEPPKARREEILGRLLEINFVLPLLNPPIFALDIDNGHAVLRGRQGIAGMAPLDLLNILAGCAEQAKAWKETYYLPPEHDPARALPARAKVERWMTKGPEGSEGENDQNDQ